MNMDTNDTPAEPAATPTIDAATANETNDTVALETLAREALRKVYDPELGMSVVELGLIRKFGFEPGKINVTMILTTPFCPYGPALIEQVRAASQEAVLRVAKVEMGLEMWEPSMMEDQAAANWGLYY
jgi:metal-sulfur cluster biosynthetic enzyme